MPAHTEGLDLAWWQESLAATSSVDGIAALAREYVAHIDTEQLAALPMPCRPGKLATSQDLADYAYELVRHHCDAEESGVAATIQDLATFFSQAAVAISKLSTSPAHARDLAQVLE